MNFKDTLHNSCEKAGFSIQDMATWLEYEYETVRLWVSLDRNPLGFKQKHIMQRITLLKKVLEAKNGGLPVPPSVTQFERKDYIEGIRDRALKGIFRAGTAD